MRPLKTLALFLFAALAAPAQAAAGPYVGYIINGFQHDCTVESRGMVFPCAESRRLYEGDEVMKRPGARSLTIKWAPYAGARGLDNATLVVTFDPPRDKKSVLEKLQEMVGFVKTEHTAVALASKGGGGEQTVFLPGDNATALPGQKITFTASGGQVESVLVKNSSGTEVFKKAIPDASEIQLTPEEIGLKPSEACTASISGRGTARTVRLRLLSRENAQVIAAALSEIDGMELCEPRRSLAKAVYLQFMSDAYPAEIDLYWLSWRLLEQSREITHMRDDDWALRQKLELNYQQRFKNIPKSAT